MGLKSSEANGVDVVVAEFRESVKHDIPQIIAFLSHINAEVREAGARTLHQLAEQGKIFSL